MLTTLAFVGGCQAPDVGQAEVVNASGRTDLTVVVVDAEDRDVVTRTLEEHVYRDTQVDREEQCLVERDGRFEVRDATGQVVVRHDFADRPMCEGDVVVLGEDGTLTWE